MINSKKAQIELTFHWIYILIAGVVILLFFVGIVARQKVVSESNLANDVLRLMNSILTSASVSANTKNFVDTSGLMDYTLAFDCVDGVSEFGIKDQSAKIQNEFQPIFSPREIKTNQLITWSLPYYFPFKVMDFLFITSVNSKYYLLGNNFFAQEFVNSVNSGVDDKHKMNIEQLENYNSAVPGNNYNIRFVDFVGNILSEGKELPNSFCSLADERVTAVSFGNGVSFYQKSNSGNGCVWKTLRRSIPIISLGGERDAAKYAAIFADDPDVYECNLFKSFQRLKFLNQIYAGKLDQMIAHYDGLMVSGDLKAQTCLLNLRNSPIQNVQAVTKAFSDYVSICLAVRDDTCYGLIEKAEKISSLNQDLFNNNCLSLY